MAKRKNDFTIGEALHNFSSQSFKLKLKLEEAKIQSIWSSTYGDYITQLTESIRLKENVVFVKFTSSVLRNEMNLNKEKVLQTIKEKMAPVEIKEIVFR
ncbi:MAG: DUF721 domain-containing protein [Saprospiraceae bacterium]|nr:DUF721 domain-containing protein [Saprospiraceae bacterium]